MPIISLIHSLVLIRVKGLENDGDSGADVDACASNNGGCSPSATCTDTHGTITCKCKPGFKGNGLTCTGKR